MFSVKYSKIEVENANIFLSVCGVESIPPALAITAVKIDDTSYSSMSFNYEVTYSIAFSLKWPDFVNCKVMMTSSGISTWKFSLIQVMTA